MAGRDGRLSNSVGGGAELFGQTWPTFSGEGIGDGRRRSMKGQ